MLEEGVDLPHQLPTSASTCRSTSCERDFDAIVLAGGATRPRDLPVPGRELAGIHFAMEYLTLQNRRERRRRRSPTIEFISAKDKHVIIIGGGDTGADCLGTAHRQGARERASARAAAAAARRARAAAIRGRSGRTSSACRRRTKKAASGCTRSRPQRFTRRRAAAASTTLHAHQVEMVQRTAGASSSSRSPDSEFELKADLVLLAMGFLGPERNGMLDQLGVRMTERGNVWRDEQLDDERARRVHRRRHAARSVADRLGDRRGPAAARGVDAYLMGRTSLPAPLA